MTTPAPSRSGAPSGADPSTPIPATPMPTRPIPTRSATPPGEGPWIAVSWAAIDVEGNGQHPDPDLVEVAVVAIKDGHVQPARSWLIRPPRPVSWQARKVHGLSTDDLLDAPTIEEVADDIVDSLHGVEVLVGHQVTVDLTVLRRSIPTWPDLPVIDTLRLARAWHPELPTHRLGALADRFHLTTDLPGPAHRAGHDATVTARLLIHLASSHPGATAQQLLDVGAPPSGQPTHHARTAPAGATDALFEVP